MLMAIQFLDTKALIPTLMDAWQSHFDTEVDAADGKWFAVGPNGNGGLFGSLTDSVAGELVFEASSRVFSRTQMTAATGIVDNRNGNTPQMSLTLTHSYENSSTTSQEVSDSVTAGTSCTISGETPVLGVEIGVSFEYTHSWSEDSSETKGETTEYSQEVQISVPSGKVYQTVLTCDKYDLEIPYFADIRLTGSSTANFRSPVQGKNAWTVDAGTLCGWIAEHGTGTLPNVVFLCDGSNPKQGLVRMRGLLRATKTVNFAVHTEDITSSYSPAK
jgi:hypothetical protein